jgi:hypothetical protein
MAQEFTIKSQDIEDKINQLLPSQGGYQPGVDFSASTMVIPVVDLTETAEGSSLRQDLQSAMSFDSITAFSITNTSSTIVNTTGYWRVLGVSSSSSVSSGNINTFLAVSDGVTDKRIIEFVYGDTTTTTTHSPDIFDFIVKLEAGQSLLGSSSFTEAFLKGSVRQLADINGNLVNP